MIRMSKSALKKLAEINAGELDEHSLGNNYQHGFRSLESDLVNLTEKEPTVTDSVYGLPYEIPIQMLRFAWQAAARDLLPKERVSKCLRYIVPGASGVDILHSAKHQRASFRNLFVCGSIWMCPICAARISEHRRVNLSDQLARLPYFPIMVTYTLRHDVSQKLATLLKTLTNAKKNLGRAESGKG